MKLASTITSVSAALTTVVCAGMFGTAILVGPLQPPWYFLVKANGALALGLCGAVLWLQRRPVQSRSIQGFCGAALAVVTGIALSNLWERVSGKTLGIDEFFARDPYSSLNRLPAGKVPFAVALAYCALVVALYSLRFARRRAWVIARTAAGLFVLGLGAFALLSHLYHADFFHRMGLPVLSIGPIGGALLVLLGAGTLFARDEGPAGVLSSRGPGGAMMRRFLPAIIAFTVFLGWLRVRGEELGLYDSSSGSAALVFASLVVLGSVGWWVARRLDADDVAKTAALERANEAATEFRQLAESIPQFVWRTDASGNTVYVNQNWLRYTGVVVPDIAAGWPEMIHPDDRPRVVASWNEAVGGAEYDVEYRLRSHDGSYRWFLARAFAVKDEKGETLSWVGTTTDIEEQKVAEREARFVAEVSRLLGASRSQEEILSVLTRMFVPEISDVSYLDLLNDDGATARVAVAYDGPDAEEISTRLSLYPPSRDCLAHPSARALFLGESVLVRTVDDEMIATFTPHAAQIEMIRRAGLRSVVSVPIRARGRIIGALALSRLRTRPRFEDRDLKFAEEIAMRVGIAVENARLYRELSDKNRLFDAVLESMPSGLVVADKTGRIILTNLAAREIALGEMTGSSREELRARYELVREDGASSAPGETPLAAALGGKRVDDVAMLARGGALPEPRNLRVSARPLLDERGGVQGAVALFTDVTDRKQLEEHRERSMLLLEATPDIVGVCGIDERVVFLNRTARQLLQVNGDPSSMRISDFHSPEVYLQLKREAMPIAIRDGFWTGETTFLRPDGTTLLTSQVLVVHYDSNRQPKYFSTLCRDITYLKESEEALRRSNEDLQQFASIISHDMQEPLRTISSYISLVERALGPDASPRAKEFMGFVGDGADRMKRMLGSLLEFSRVTSMGRELQPVESERAFRNALDNLRSAIKNREAVVTASELPRVKADLAQIEQLFQNLIGNAIKYSERRPEVTVSARPGGGRFVCFAVKDNGIGIEMRHADRVFQIFQRLHSREEYEGTGVGLSVCKRIVERHGGHMWVESEPGLGSTFFFTLPGA